MSGTARSSPRPRGSARRSRGRWTVPTDPQSHAAPAERWHSRFPRLLLTGRQRRAAGTCSGSARRFTPGRLRARNITKAATEFRPGRSDGSTHGRHQKRNEKRPRLRPKAKVLRNARSRCGAILEASRTLARPGTAGNGQMHVQQAASPVARDHMAPSDGFRIQPRRSPPPLKSIPERRRKNRSCRP